MFQNSVFYQHINNIDKDLLKQKFQAFKTNYQDPAKTEQIKSSKEEQYQEGFLRDIFVNILGYTINPEPNFNLITEKRNESSDKKNTRKADAAIIIDNKTKCVIELKGCNTTNLNKVVSQVLDYKGHHSGCRYMVISNFAKLQFYIDDATKFIEFDLFNLDYDNFKKLYTLLAYEQIKADIPALIKEQSISREEDITKKFYKDYSDFKNALFDNICELNPSFDKLELFTKTQKLLDRFLFIFFCEDKGLLAPNSMDGILERYNKLKRWDEYKPLYDLIKKFFAWIDTGFKNEHFDIFAYNGGLFKTDDLLDNLKISDDLLQKHCKKLADYNFDSEISVDILGHIFEHSISEIEIKQNELKGIQKADKRKKDGVFYTPAYITKYIVESTLGTLCEAKKNELGINDADFADINANKRKDKISKIAILKKYREFLFGLKICDPACGSGAFLNATLKFLKAEHQLIDEMENNFYGTPLQLNYNDNKILENNIYGVDINSESVDIAKLSLWLNTAKKGEKLTTLTDNIKCGNSLISDEFDWQKEFPKVFENGGFDVIIGNPPYFNVQTLGAGSSYVKYLQENYTDIWQDKSDILFYFIDKALEISKNKIGFIISNAFLFSDKAQKLRAKILKSKRFSHIVNFEKQKIFADAGITTCMVFFENNPKPFKAMNLKDDKLSEIEISNFIENKNNFFNVALKENSVFALVDDNIAKINKKIDGNHKPLREILKIGKGMETAANEVFCFDYYPNKFPKEFIKKRMCGEIIEKYNLLSKDEYILYFENVENFADLPLSIQEHLNKNKEKLSNRATVKNEGRIWWKFSRPMHKEFYNLPKIWCSYRCKSNKFVLDESSDFIGLTNTTVIFGTDPEISLKYILCLLNSSTLNFRYKSIGKQTGSGVYEYFENGVGNLPIVIATKELQKQLADFADEMIRLNAEISSLSNDFFTILRANNYEIAKIPTALNEFYNLDFKEFLKLTKLKIDMSKQGDLLKFFNNYKQQCQTLNKQIVKTESKINQSVYKLYELNDDEIKMIENG